MRLPREGSRHCRHARRRRPPRNAGCGSGPRRKTKAVGVAARRPRARPCRTDRPHAPPRRVCPHRTTLSLSALKCGGPTPLRRAMFSLRTPRLYVSLFFIPCLYVGFVWHILHVIQIASTENTNAFHPLETRARAAPLTPRTADRSHQDLLRHQTHRGKHRRPRGPLPRRSSPRKSRQALLHRPGPEAAWLGRLSTTRAPSRTLRNSIIRYNVISSILWKSASARRRTRARLVSRFATASSVYGAIACATTASSASFSRPSLSSSSWPSATAASSTTTNQAAFTCRSENSACPTAPDPARLVFCRGEFTRRKAAPARMASRR